MAKATLPVNYVDDVMNKSVGGKRKYRMIYNDDGTVSFEDVTPYDQVGSDFGAGDINATNKAVNASADASKIIDDMDAINALTQPGYIAGGLALKEVNSSLKSILNIASVEINSIKDIWVGASYPNGFTMDNCIIVSSEIYDSANNTWFLFPMFGSSAYSSQAVRITATKVEVFNNNVTNNLYKVKVTLMKIK